MNFNEQIDSIVDRFDFQAIVAYVEVMRKPPFKKHVPRNMGTPEEVKALAKQMLMNVSKLKEDSVITNNGLEAERIESQLELRFVPLRTNMLSIMHE